MRIKTQHEIDLINELDALERVLYITKDEELKKAVTERWVRVYDELEIIKSKG